MAGPSISMSQQQRQIMTLAPQLRQSLDMLQMPVLELRASILKEMEQNPTIDGIDDPNEILISDQTPEVPEKHVADEPLDADPDIDTILRQDDEWRDYFMKGMENAASNDDADEKRQYILDSITTRVSLQEHLLEQMTLLELSESEREMMALLIGNIGKDGYFVGSIPDLMMISGMREDEILRLLTKVQSFDPPGIGASSLRECLLAQLEMVEDSPWENEARLLIDKYLPKLASRDEKFLCNVLGLDSDELQHVIRLVRSFNPRPGLQFESDDTEYVEPEVFVTKKEGKFVATVDGRQLPFIRISKQYRRLLEDKSVSAETKSYVRERIRAGAFLIRSIHQRQETIRKIAQEIVDAQSGFLLNGIKDLQPMTMAEVADKVGVHETTVSRTVANKYMRTPVGVFELKYFFTPGLKTKGGETISNKSVQDIIYNLISQEDPAAPLSDQAIEALLKEQGVIVARRTISKYRGVLRIPPSHRRRIK
ncbi:MAG: RNA polymerase factor sigma-54 [Kiritimatiellae bacterium]|nr:RNA polymerase factor sigma-54 [Kiritimatiellia bacterium]